ncbi:MAG: hypothetical protein DRK00_00060 [Thermoprotei archaeon]|nr:MAG: hypothetical protein DRK00_00060 [Thermoprotei archaeon]
MPIQLTLVPELQLRVSVGQQELDLTLTACRIDELRPHERVVPSYLEELKAAFKRSVYQRNPIIVDSASGVILDGTHRWAAMKALGYKWIAVCKVDYLNPLVLLDRWARRYRVKEGYKLSSLLEGLNYEPIRPEDVGDRDLAVIRVNEAYRIRYAGLTDAYTKAQEIEERLASLSGSGPTYMPGDQALEEREGVAVLPPVPLKREILELARSGILLPPKSTRHIIPARPLGVNVPLKLLMEDHLDLELLGEVLRQRRPVLLRAPVSLDREYREIVLYFM